MLLVISVRVAVSPKHNIFVTYETAGLHWVQGADLYTTDQGRGFVYSPLAAASFAPFSLLPDAIGRVLWRLLNAAVYLGAIFWWLRSGINGRLSAEARAAIFLLLVPLSLGNFNNGQVNPLVIGLLMFGILGARAELWTLAAFCVAAAAYLKIYPLAAGLLLVLAFPVKFGWRLALALLLLGALPFVLQRPTYVLAQYHGWVATRATDDRRLYEHSIAPHDLWLVLKAMSIPITERAYSLVELLSAGGVACVCLAGRLLRWPLNRLLAALFTLVCCWMVLLGPATESPTYILLAPATAFAVVQAFEEERPGWLRGLAAASMVFFIAGFAINSFVRNRDAYEIVQPLGAILFSCYALVWLLTPRYWAACAETGVGLPARENGGARAPAQTQEAR